MINGVKRPDNIDCGIPFEFFFRQGALCAALVTTVQYLANNIERVPRSLALTMTY